MNNWVNFIVESGVSLSVFALIYLLFLRRETFFRLNRFYLLISLAFSVLLPFLKLRVYDPQPVMLSEITVTPYRNLMEAVTIYGRDFSGTVEQTISSSRVIVMVYLLGLLFLLGRFIFRLIQIFVLIRKNPVQYEGKVKFVLLDKNFSPFSFLGYVFVNPATLNSGDGRKMVAHEMEHIKQGHSFDVVVLEILTVFQWFNPFMWMLRHAIRENHEFLADQAVLNSGINKGYYKKLLLNQFVGGQLVIANSFNYSLIKNRIKMMSKIKSSKTSNIKIIFGVLVAVALIITFACEQKETLDVKPPESDPTMKASIRDENLKIEGAPEELEKVMQMFSENSGFVVSMDSLGNVVLKKKKAEPVKVLNEGEQVFFIVEEMPEFPGGELALRKFIANSISYPEIAQESGIQGKVYVTFVVSKDGSIANAKIARGVDPSIDKEALRVVNSLPKWKPGVQRGVPVNVSYTVPINFVLQ
jgi:TonB family protein